MSATAGLAQSTLTLSALPEEDPKVLSTRYDALAATISQRGTHTARYLSQRDSPGALKQFREGKIDVLWASAYALARLRAEGTAAEPLITRLEDKQHRSVFLSKTSVGNVTDVASLEDLRGKTLCVGAQSSAAGNWMPRAWLAQVGLTQDFVKLRVTGSHEAALRCLVDGRGDAAVVHANVWSLAQMLAEFQGLKAFYDSETFLDYSWIARPGLDAERRAQFKNAMGTLGALDLASLKATRFVDVLPAEWSKIVQIVADSKAVEAK